VHSLLRFQLLTPAECRRALAIAARLKRQHPRTDDPMFDGSGAIAWVKRSPAREWLFARIEEYGLAYARRHRIDVEGLDGPLQYTEYGPEAEFDWHIDTGTASTLHRKVTVSVQLSSAAEYDGGQLEFVGEYRELLSKGQGNATAFSAALGHRVRRVTRGTRRVLVGWMHGPPYR
jgi:2-oxoglutarate-Fe(II)-dependent oxygenase superfamily protein